MNHDDIRYCSIEGCNSIYSAKGLCDIHYRKSRSKLLKNIEYQKIYQKNYRNGVTKSKIIKYCNIEGCNSIYSAKGLCDIHYRKLRSKLLKAIEYQKKYREDKLQQSEPLIMGISFGG